ncbi:MAG: chromosome segregation protein SMC [Deltaproteobacteria bacterium]|nr:chromosome segregation protein SMC [Deltaproteobacteria bacterium]
MRLRSLEMLGLKSFAEKMTLHFPPGITAIVGPNGCGKSNIVDALRWVMGEQSARHLRGHMMEDVIFNGSESLPPIGMAEVSLILDNEDGRGPTEYSSFSEIMITRRLFRSGDSEYEINKVPCRLKDVIELFLGTGVGNKAYSIVEQGRVDELVNAKPDERRALIEEAAGTSKYKSRKQLAERKLERTQQNLLRVNDIVREIERQIRSMELQAKKAERYKGLKRDLKEKEIAWAILRRKRLEGDISRLDEKLRDVEDKLVQLLATLNSKEAEGESIRLTLFETDKEIASRQEALYQQKIRIQTEDQSIAFYKRERSGLDETEKKARSEIGLLREKLQSLQGEIEELTKARESFVQLSLFEETYLKDKESELEKIRAQIRAAISDLEAARHSQIEILNQAAHLRNDLAAAAKRREEICKESDKNRREASEATISLESWRVKEQQQQAIWETCQARARETAVEAARAAESVKEWSLRREEQERKIEELKEKLQESRSRLLSLEDLQKNYEGYQEGVRAIMLKRQREAAFDGVHGLVAEVVEAPEAYEKALTAVLGDRLQCIIVQSHDEGIEAIEYLKRESSGRGSFVPRRLYRKEQRPLPLGEPEVVASLLNMVSVKEGYGEIAEYLLSDVVLVRDLKSGLALWNRNGFVNTLVTPEGEVIDPMGIVTGGSAETLEGGLLAQRRRMKELEAVISELQAEFHGEEREFLSIKSRISESEARRAALLEEDHRLALERIRLEHESLQAKQEIERLEETLRVLDQEHGDFLATDSSLQEIIRDLESKIELNHREKTEKESILTDKQEALSQLEKELSRIDAEATESRVRGAALGERKQHAHINLENRLRAQREIHEQIRARESEILQIAKRRDELDATIEQASSSLEDGIKALQDAERGLENERAKYREISRQLADIQEQVKELRPAVDSAQQEKNQLQLLLSEKRLNLQHLFDTIREKHEVDLQETPAEALDENASEESFLAEIEELRGRMERMGEVNLAAIGEFEELNTRYQFLSQQKQDLDRSVADLQQTIAKLNRLCRLRFRESFEEINQKFQEIFPRMFRGGKARLILTDENDYLETGVEIVAQPPGKKLQSITLLSGGEKALTAVSLLFAIFLTKPSPFCFLDEVDAPLDDANIDRFNEMIKEMSQTSQFILITHNKRTMQAAEVLYGITMAEPGVSKVVSVKMS